MGIWVLLKSICFPLVQDGTVDLSNFEHVPYFEHHVNIQFLSLQHNKFHPPTYIQPTSNGRFCLKTPTLEKHPLMAIKKHTEFYHDCV